MVAIVNTAVISIVNTAVISILNTAVIYHGISSLEKCRYCGNLLWYFKNIGPCLHSRQNTPIIV
jgi:hypothetical protein